MTPRVGPRVVLACLAPRERTSGVVVWFLGEACPSQGNEVREDKTSEMPRFEMMVVGSQAGTSENLRPHAFPRRSRCRWRGTASHLLSCTIASRREEMDMVIMPN